ncbi:hypothetical protein O6H91_07G033300 [Diphasiastrum complanatum]|uniref:Uncharacterized protein n=3 Tax=Diphasiastrum complanatum TaxID=34168 RepID=A0ACC2D3Y2_DIPCM|nr:hypothetical protein O6H91_07G033300 [Diphasiastrum complanatum]KAJ7548927.1 hypothetical protein O6H91_07G033300 [Diphasiastrum complanatum]KAJ7548928.1 hypothetical protein O6H91_07G033300 [Diphasiastrum complanatum]
MGRLASMPSRVMGTSEANWCRAVDGGTGVTVTGLLYAKPLEVGLAEAAIISLLAEQPLLRATVEDRDGKPWFIINDSPSISLEEIDRSSEAEGEEPLEEEDGESRKERWLKIVEEEMNKPFPKVKPFPVFQALLYRLPQKTSLLILRTHSGACDLASAAPISSHIVQFLGEFAEAEKSGQSVDQFLKSKEDASLASVVRLNLPSMESAVPPEMSKKPFWAHGVDMIGYGLVSRRHAYLPFDVTKAPWHSCVIRSRLTREATEQLIQGCEKHSTNLFGALCAAGTKVVAAFKKVGNRGEHYGNAVLLNCRNMLEPVIPPSAVGFYHAAMLKTLHVAESVPFWELAKKSSEQVEEAIKNKKHFKDMSDLNTLMVQAMNFPNVTPSGTMRTTLLSIYHDPIPQSFADAASSNSNLTDWVTCSSVNGVGPCLALYPFLTDGCLQVNYVYCSPLFSHTQIQQIVDGIQELLTETA